MSHKGSSSLGYDSSLRKRKRQLKNHGNEEKKYKEETNFKVSHHNDFTLYTPCIDGNKSWADIMDEEDALREKEERRLEESRALEKSKMNRNTKPSDELAWKPFRPWKDRNPQPIETNEKRLAVRARQVEIGKNTEGYKNFIRDVPRHHRTVDHPWTPDRYKVCSTRSWQGLMRIWRKKLHFWDPPHLADEYKKRSFFNFSASSTGETLEHSGDSKCSSQTSDEFTGSNDYVLSEKDLFDDERMKEIDKFIDGW